MPPKSDINRSGRETTDFPSVCESCLGRNPYIQMIKEESGLECKICTRPFTVFRWSVDRTVRNKKTNICLTCARLKNCCQCCMLDLSFGLPIAIRDAALKLVAQGPASDINKQYYAQNHDGELKDGDVPEEYEKTDGAARDLLKRLATSEPYYKRRRGDADGAGEDGDQQKLLTGGPGPIRSRGGARGGRGGGGRGRGGGARGGRFPGANQLPATSQDILPPSDLTITSLFLTGVEDDLAEHHIRTFFSAFGQIKSIVCVHRSRCAFVNFASRAGAEAAAESCQGKAVIGGCPLRIQWGKPRPLGNVDRSHAQAMAQKKAGVDETMHEAEEMDATRSGGRGRGGARGYGGDEEAVDLDSVVVARPPGAEDAEVYPTQAS
ncbi:hypothetical protein EDC01DRAFT_712096 [Geopyxis carbonaria]|nr:hypothetical protein EDC01DRAFT_712096 [Geopyxis carbonaria]